MRTLTICGNDDLEDISVTFSISGTVSSEVLRKSRIPRKIFNRDKKTSPFVVKVSLSSVHTVNLNWRIYYRLRIILFEEQRTAKPDPTKYFAT